MADIGVTVFGGSGFIGRHLVRRLSARPARVRIAARHPDHTSDANVEAVLADVLDDTAVASAVSGSSAVINLVGILSESERQTYRALHVEAARRVALAAKKAGALRLIHVSALGAAKGAPALSDRTKAEGEEVVRAVFPETTIVRPSLVFGSGDHFFTRWAAMAQRSPVLPLIGGGATKFQPTDVGDVAAGMARILERSDTAEKTYEFGGPEVYSFKELLELLLAAFGWRRVLLPIPFPIAYMLAQTFDLLPAAPVTRDQVLLLKTHKIKQWARADSDRPWSAAKGAPSLPEHVHACERTVRKIVKQKPEFALRVGCSPGYRGEPTPRRFSFGGAWIEVTELLDLWLAPDHRYFKVRADDGASYILRNDVRADRWELTMYDADNRR
jgi:NADH dehydrogenase